MKILNRMIGPSHPPLVIAEIGINHGGSINTALEMVDAAKRAGVEVVKHQTHIVEDEMSQKAKSVIPGNSDKSIYEIMANCALGESEEAQLKEYVESQGMIFISTPFSRAAVDRLERMNVPAYKIGSGECNNYPLIELIAKLGKPIILSTGMNDIPSIRGAVNIFKKHKVQYALLHTTNLYPTPPELVRLGALQELQASFPDTITGLSDHTTSNLACLAATALGASILERHFTDSMDRVGPDIINSMDERNARSLIHDSKEIWTMRGGSKRAAKEEQVTIDFAFSTVVTIETIQKGETLTEDNIWVKRPGTGEIPAKEFSNLIGKKASRDIDTDTHLSWSDIQKIPDTK